MSQSGKKLRLTIVEGDQDTRVEEIDGDVAPIKIGRLSSSHLRFEDSSVSRIHAVIEKSADGSYHLIDLGSASGTFVNGEKITKDAIASGDELQFGDVVVTLEIVDAQAEAEDEPQMEFGGEATVITTSPQEDETAVREPLNAQLEQQVQPTQSSAAPMDQTTQYDPAAADTGAVSGSSQSSNDWGQPQPSAASGSEDLITTADGRQVEPYTLQGYYDEGGNYIPGYYDEAGDYQFGYGYYDEAGDWQVAFGYYDAEGEWVETPYAIASLEDLEGPSDMDYYTEVFFDDDGGDTLEVAMLWSDQVLAVNSYPTPRSVTIGSGKKVDFVVTEDLLSTPEHPLVVFDGVSYQLVFTDKMRGMVQSGQRAYTLEEAIAQGVATQSGAVPGAYTIALNMQSSARIDVGDVTFLIHFTDQPAIVGGPIGIDWSPILYVTISGILHIAFVIIALVIPVSPGSLELDTIREDDRFVQAMITPEQQEEEEPDFLGDDAGEEAAAKHAGEEGEAGKEDSEQTDKEMAIKGPKDNTDVELKKAYDTEVAMNSGALAVLGDQVSSPFGASDNSVGSDAIHALGGMEGEGVGESKGFGGLGMAGSGRGGGGISERGIGLANVGTKGRGGRGGGGKSYGKKASDLGDKKTRVPKLVPGKPKVMGSLDREIIRRVVRQHRNEIRYCYERELQKNPKLAGVVKVKFTISGTGSVISALVSSTTLKNARVERCMTGKIRHWVFPEPKGGGIVVVNYPFNFSS